MSTSPRSLRGDFVMNSEPLCVTSVEMFQKELWRAVFDRVLCYAVQDKLPNRPNRTYEREAYNQRPQSAQFKKRPPKKSRINPNS